MAGSSADVSERKRIEYELRRALHQAELFVAVVSHDLRTPLSAILSGAEVGMRRTSDAEVRKVFDRIASSGRRMQRLVEQVLDVTRIRAGGGLALEPNSVDMAALCRGAIEELEGACPDAQFQVDVSGDCTGQWDGDRLSQLVGNLLSNAVHHGAKGTPARVAVDGRHPDRVVLRMWNAGAIEQEMLESLFEPFRRGNGQRRDGLGLGLFVARAVARAHGGDVTVESSAADGTTFVIDLPRQPPRQGSDRPSVFPGADEA
jgi:signal transduction histidine kinase